MLRFAPSPTGDMHVENLRIALFNFLIATQRGESFIVRIEDTDTHRVVEGKDKEILELLALFGIEYKEVIYQSNHLKYHRAMAIQLLHDKKAFNCFCTPAQLDAKRQRANEAKKPFYYDDTCLHLTPEETIDNENPFTIRLRRPESDIKVADTIQGHLNFSAQDVDSFVIMDEKKLPTYNFACAIDDMISDVSFVIRSQEHLSDTPKQIAIRSALGYDKEIEYAHLPMMSNSDAVSVKWLLEEGFLPDAIANYLISMSNKVATEIFTLKEALEWFTLDSISKSPEKFDIDKLKFINCEHLKRLEAKELSRYVGFADDEIGALAHLYLKEAKTLKELRSKIEPIFAQKAVPKSYLQSVNVLKEVIKSAPFFNHYADFKTYTMRESALDEKTYLVSLRLILTGAQSGPELADIYMYLKNYLVEVVK
jgi:glutamyl-tRNA synthetase